MIGMKCIRWMYKRIFRPALFRIDPERIHDIFIFIGRILGANIVMRNFTALFFRYDQPMLEQEVLGIRFKNPIGLAAGFDKNAKLGKILPAVGFGFVEVGSVTGEPCEGNAGTRLWRLPKSEGIVVNYGLSNDGAEVVCTRLRGHASAVPIGVNIAKTNVETTIDDENGMRDYLKSFNVCSDVGSYYTINVSCPNSYGGESFQRPDALNMLLTRVDRLQTSKPMFVKLSADITTRDLDEIIEVTDRHRVHGFVLSNLTKRHDAAAINKEEIRDINVGGVSGKPTGDISNALISYLYKKTNGRYVVLGCGGVFSAEDAYEKIRRGASLVQLVTGMIYEGPQLIGEINKGLVRLLEKDGYSNVSEAVGVYHR